MVYKRLPTNLPALLRAEGLTVVEMPGWKTAGRPSSTGGFNPVGVLWHHTGGPSDGGRRYVEGILTHGRSDLPGPLCNVSIDGAGVVYLVASGRANHAGVAKSAGSVAAGDGNELYVGIEVQNSGTEGYSHEQYTAMVLTTKVLLTKVTKTSVRTLHSHYETSVTGKWDPGNPRHDGGVPFKGHYVLDMDASRADVKAAIESKAKPVPKPKKPKPVVPVGLTWNLLTGRDPGTVGAGLKRLIKNNHKPAFAALQEDIRYGAVTRTVATLLGYRLYRPKRVAPKPKGVHVSESGSTALMVRRDVKVCEHGVIRARKTWVGPKIAALHEGRVMPWAVIKLNGEWTLVVAVHLPTGGRGKNEAAWLDTITRIEKLADEKKLPFIILGDWNWPHSRGGAPSPSQLAKRLGAKIVHTDTAIDYALVKGLSLKAKRGSKRGSDHHPVILTGK